MKKFYNIITCIIILTLLACAGVEAAHPCIFLVGDRLTLLEDARDADSTYWLAFESAFETGWARLGPSDWGLAYQMTSNTDYSDQAILEMFDDTKYVGSAMPSDYVDARWRAIGAALTFDWVYDQLTTQEKTDAVDWLNDYATGIYTEWYSYYHNWEPAILWVVGLIGLATEGDNDSAATWISFASTLFADGVATMQQFLDGGSWPEGMQYGTALAGVTDYMEAAYSAKSQNLYTQIPEFEDVLRFYMYQYHRTASYYGYTESTSYTTRHWHAHDFAQWSIDAVSGYRGKDNVQLNRKLLNQISYRFPNPYGKYMQYFLLTLHGDDLDAKKDGEADDFLWGTTGLTPTDMTGLDLAYHAEDAGVIFMKSDWGANATWISFQAGNHYVFPHRHLDEGSFQIYSHNGDLAIDSGSYGSYASSMLHLEHYGARTIAHNSLLIYKASETFRYVIHDHGPTLSNDGGQHGFYDSGTIRPVDKDDYLASVDRLDVSDIDEFGHSAVNNYTYARADITNAYNSSTWVEGSNTSKVTKVEREIFYLHGAEEFFIVFDRVNSTDSAYLKSWVLHSVDQMTITGEDNFDAGYDTYTGRDEIIITEGSGRVFVKIVVPTAPQIYKVGGANYEDYVNGTNYPIGQNRHEYGAWRVQVQPTVAVTDDLFLHVLFLTASSTSSMPATVKIDGTDMVGTFVSDRSVMFSKTGGIVTSDSFTLDGSGDVDVLIANVTKSAAHTVTIDGSGDTVYGSSASGVLSFTVNLSSSHVIGFTLGDTVGYAPVFLWLDQSDIRSYGDSANWHDISGNGNHGTQTTAEERPAITGAAGLAGSSRLFDGTNDTIELGDVLDETVDSFTIVVWIKRDGKPSALEALVTKRNTVGYGVYINTDGRIQSVIQDSGGSVTSTNDGTDIADNAWHMAAVVYDRDGNMTSYVDGFPDGSPDSISAISGTLANSDDFLIGDDASGSSYFFEGYISLVGKYVRDLTAAEVQRVYLAEKPRYGGL